MGFLKYVIHFFLQLSPGLLEILSIFCENLVKIGLAVFE